MNKKVKYGLLAGFPALAFFVYKNFPKLTILTGFAAKNVCSCIFEAGRDLDSIEEGDNNFLPVYYAQNKIDYLEKSVTSTILGLKKRTAVYRDGVGCVLLPETTTKFPNFHKPDRELVSSPSKFISKKFHLNSFVENDAKKSLKLAVSNAFDPPAKASKKTRAVLVIHKDHLIAEKYASGFSKDTKFLGWSMTKSIVNALLGILEKQGKISLQQDNLFQEWKDDERSKITINNLLQMNSGLEWVEDYTTISDVTKMLFVEDDMSNIQLNKKLKGKPGHSWNYSSGTTNLLSRFIRNQFKSDQEYLDFWYKEFIDKIGMNSMIIETDFRGNYIGSSYGWATARDWAKFGMLYLKKGVWNGEQIFNESWVNYSATPTNGSNGEYGAHFWLNAEGKYPNVPKDLFSSCGFQGQYIFIIPSKDLVIVRFGLTEHPDFDIDSFINEIIDAVEKPS